MGALKIGFAGTPEFARRILSGLIAHEKRPLVVYTQPDRPIGRGRKVVPGPVRTLAEDHQIEVLQPLSLKHPEAASQLRRYGLDVLVVAAYGLLLPPEILIAPTRGCINVHASILPRWRGAAPIERAIMAGDTATGVSIMQMDKGLDTGPVYLTRHCPIATTTTGPELESRLADLGLAALVECLDQLPDLKPLAQTSVGACYAKKLSPVDARIQWIQPATTIDRQVRALCGRMPAFSFSNGVRLQILEATADPGADHQALPGTVIGATGRSGIQIACGAGSLAITRLQLSRGKGLPLTAAQALNGFSDLLAEGCMLHAEPS